ncbi:MAG: LysE family transporter [Sulfolobales archaeon]
MEIRYSGDLRRIVFLTLAISPSGALSPGPLSISAIALGALLGPLAGLSIGFGHMLFELPYVFILHRFTLVARSFLERIKYYLNIGVFIFLVYFSYLLIIDALKILSGMGSGVSFVSRGFSLLDALLTGLLLTGFNAYFLIWWITVGYPLIETSSKNGSMGFAVMYSSHVWMDYVWLTLLASGGRFIETTGKVPYSILLMSLAGVLLYFAIKIFIDAISGLVEKFSGINLKS